MVSPRSVLASLFTSVTAADFTMVIIGDWFTGVDVDEGPEAIGGPPGGVAWAVAVLLTTPASTSAWEMVWAVVAVAGLGGRWGQCHTRARRRPGRRIGHPHAREGDRAGVGHEVGPGDGVTEVGLAVAVHVGDRGGLRMVSD